MKRGKKVAEKTLAVNGATVAVWMDTNDEEEKEEEEEEEEKMDEKEEGETWIRSSPLGRTNTRRKLS